MKTSHETDTAWRGGKHAFQHAPRAAVSKVEIIVKCSIEVSAVNVLEQRKQRA